MGGLDIFLSLKRRVLKKIRIRIRGAIEKNTFIVEGPPKKVPLLIN
jgi:hypothetical protein